MIIGVCGHKGAGKDTSADYLTREFNFHKIALADPMKWFIRDIFDFSGVQLWGPSEEREKPDLRYPREDGSYLTPREALQLLGTEWGRRCYPDVWVKHAMRKARHLEGTTGSHVVISDVRFRNEVEAIVNGGGRVIRLLRGSGGMSGHASETEQDSIPKELFSKVIDNRDMGSWVGVPPVGYPISALYQELNLFISSHL